MLHGQSGQTGRGRAMQDQNQLTRPLFMNSAPGSLRRLKTRLLDWAVTCAVQYVWPSLPDPFPHSHTQETNLAQCNEPDVRCRAPRPQARRACSQVVLLKWWKHLRAVAVIRSVED